MDALCNPANMPFSDRSRPLPFLLFLPPIIKVSMLRKIWKNNNIEASEPANSIVFYKFCFI
ncbi:hypothetical protein HMPREF0083_00506 [Aneurinibacillus aneurinilyticus ATCC 12856]|uniref:Uncharacterized protein n=1 Tax=Aneurinibacillus aneurinilyticus ATCC 12856 TaxID=649747 RepID=U1YGZ5_ANEAE|nr:hypothetical protein HMPREF0083_00506 [Aneurinibacillus aneurinilyticus ATCC 12856]